MMDSLCWVEDRIFFSRFLLLNVIIKSDELLDEWAKVISLLPDETNVIQTFPPLSSIENLTLIGEICRKDLNLEDIMQKYKVCPFSTLENFYSDFNVYGLREAIAYLCDVPEVSDSVIVKFVEFYVMTASVFLDLLDLVKSNCQDALKAFMADNPKLFNGRSVEQIGEMSTEKLWYIKRLILQGEQRLGLFEQLVIEGINYVSAWGNGQKQICYA